MGLPFTIAVVALLGVLAAVVGFPIYGWLRDKKRRGESIGVHALVGVILVGLIGAAALALFGLARDFVSL